MRKTITLFIIATAAAAPAQQSQPQSQPSPAIPQLSTAESVALQAISKASQQLLEQLRHNNELTHQIVSDFAAAHPGYHIDEQTGQVVRDAPVAPKPVSPGTSPSQPTTTPAPPTSTTPRRPPLE